MIIIVAGARCKKSERARGGPTLGMVIYSMLLTLALSVSAPWWLARMALNGRYRAGLAGRLGIVPADLRLAVAEARPQRRLVWLHAVSVGEWIGAERLVVELRKALPDYQVVVSTTTAAGQSMAKQRSQAIPVFFFPLDFAFAVRPYLRILRPSLFILMESELWPRMLTECSLRRVPVAVVNARISDRSYARYMRLRVLWRPLLAKVRLFLAQGDESAQRLRRIGVADDHVFVSGNLKYDGEVPLETAVVARLRPLVSDRMLFVAGSTLRGEEALLLDAWTDVLRVIPDAILMLAPRHPQRFPEVDALLRKRMLRYETVSAQPDTSDAQRNLPIGAIILLDTLGDLASAYRLASAAFVGGSLVAKGGHNPLEAARFGVPIVMGESYENFREIVEAMRSADAIRIVAPNALADAIIASLKDGAAMGARGRLCFEAEAGATRRTVDALLGLLAESA